MSKCLYCYKELGPNEHDFHASCARKFFGTTETPVMEYTRADMDQLAEKIIQSQTTLTGVQPKLSLNLQQLEGTRHLTIVGLWGYYIFKPQADDYPQLPENEDLTIDQSLGYLTKRMDRDTKGNKLAMEDFCQLTERQTEYKYRSSHEQIAKAIAKYSSTPQLDLVNYYELLLFCWLTGNNDMHLKNFSLLSNRHGGFGLSPAYDLLNVAIANPKDTEELALTLNGRKKRITLKDFKIAASQADIPEKVIDGMAAHFRKCLPAWEATIVNSFLSKDLQQDYLDLLHDRFERIKA